MPAVVIIMPAGGYMKDGLSGHFGRYFHRLKDHTVRQSFSELQRRYAPCIRREVERVQSCPCPAVISQVFQLRASLFIVQSIRTLFLERMLGQK